VVSTTIKSAIGAGLPKKHIYVVDDSSTDKTFKIARQILPKKNVCKVRRSGKGLAVAKARKKFNLVEKYRWIHVADADGAFAPNYFTALRRELRVKNAAATGYVRSLPGGYISQFRTFDYTVGMEIHRRFQAIFDVIPIIPGPTSCFRSDIFERLNFANNSLTEDFDVTLQIYREKMGNIQFVKDAVVFTQDPKTLKDFIKQITRWHRGVMQGVSAHKIGRKPSAIDAYISFQVLQNVLVFANYFIWIPILAIAQFGINALAAAFIFDVCLMFGMVGIVSLRMKHTNIISAFPFVYVLRWVNIAVFWKAFVEVGLLRKFRDSKGIWSNANRRYKIIGSFAR
jgi:cellulose synthase/poly-beta-1,6-N-acetylglucosamine synthase-like glycosyltransferase